MRTTVVIGYDAVSPLGTELSEQWDRAVRGESGIGHLTRFPITKDFPVQFAGQVSPIDPGPYPFLKPRAMANWTSPIFKHALLVVHRALKNSGIEITPDLAPKVGVTFSSAVGGVDAVLNADRIMIKEGKLPHPFANPNSCINMAGGKVSMLTGATGPIVSTVTACATGVTSISIGAMFIKQHLADVVICGAVDFALVEPIVAGFATMNGAFRNDPDHPESPETSSRPFSVHRKGFIVSEGAGCIIIASKEFAKAHGLHYQIEIAGWSMTSDAYHFVAPNPVTVKHCIAKTIDDAGIRYKDVNAVNAHAASTKAGDKVEFTAMKELFGNIPPVSANKSMIGHAMGASSAIESIFAMEGMRRNILLPTINYQADPEMELDCTPEGARTLHQDFVLKNAFGFGGCNSCMVFRRIQ